MSSDIGTRLREFRKFKNISQTEMADTLSVAQSMISKLENGNSALDADKIQALANKYGLNPTWLILGTGEMILSEQGDVLKELKVLRKYVETLEKNSDAKDEIIEFLRASRKD